MTATNLFESEIALVQKRREMLRTVIKGEKGDGLTEAVALAVQMNLYLCALVDAKEIYRKHTEIMRKN